MWGVISYWGINCILIITKFDKVCKYFFKKIKNYLGFVGTLSSGDKKNVIICAVIDDKKSPIYAEFENLSDPLKEKITKKICL